MDGLMPTEKGFEGLLFEGVKAVALRGVEGAQFSSLARLEEERRGSKDPEKNPGSVAGLGARRGEADMKPALAGEAQGTPKAMPKPCWEGKAPLALSDDAWPLLTEDFSSKEPKRPSLLEDFLE